MAVALLIILFIVLACLRVPIAISLGASSVIALWMIDFSIETVVQKMFSAIDSTTLMAIPGFILAGLIMAHGGISKYLIEALKVWIGHTKGGLAVVTVLACTVFSAISGSSPATAAAIGSIMIPAMVTAGYQKNYAMGLVATAGTLGILIPPSITLILYGMVTEQSTKKLFTAGIIPGLLLSLLLVITVTIVAYRKGYGGLPKVPLAERWKPTLMASWGLLFPVFILGSIYTGIVTPTEASFLSVAYALLVSLLVYRELTWSSFRKIMTESVNTTAMIFLIIASATIFGMFLTTEQIPHHFAEWIGEAGFHKWTFLILVCLLYFFLGMFLEATSILLITVPIFLPILTLLDINLIHFAIILVINMELAMITPPVGLNIFVISGIAKERVESVIKGVYLFYFVMLVCLALIIIFPEISLFLVK
ncbi:TRAP transporter large permease [Brevibacillus ruminantium]|uniref:TRAP transporter large permease n=1 Tax=Brevibacillus ruminantium TaxID=2950604 RepID=A0ABY4WCV8_9BACL|nr:TRAP transporter large permease [Brevibacillus ruminantium]USG65007.1 TRAP transporter large permease [Brevibacillus ruminantium]